MNDETVARSLKTDEQQNIFPWIANNVKSEKRSTDHPSGLKAHTFSIEYPGLFSAARLGSSSWPDYNCTHFNCNCSISEVKSRSSP